VKRARIANQASTRTTELYDRRSDEVSLDEVERILI
jgi:integrase/recombinase XerD